ncbi:Clp protease N-terminal domain-containing protein, partial [Methyloceanibacter sp.]|uniref:Clp protease N-terminal domain-containing protein n=1 Tax=Methyloceanibacter sp. TaxID=1965321 RepID=UPI002D4ED453
MDFEKLSDRLKGFIQAAQTLALRDGNPQITPEHLLKVLLDDPDGMASGLMARAGGNPKQALERTNAALAKLPKVSGSGATQPHMSPSLARVLDQAEQMAGKAGDSFVTVERALQALGMTKEGETQRILADAGLTPQGLNAAINELRKGRTADSAGAEQAYDALKKYTRDFTEAAAK